MPSFLPESQANPVVYWNVRLPFPERLPLFQIVGFCLVLFTVQQLEGTSAVFSLGTFLFVFIAAMAFNLAGGLTRPSGGFVFAFTMLAGLFGITYKALMNQPAQTNLSRPEVTIGVYVAATFAMLIAVYVSKLLRFKTRFFPTFKSDEDMYRACVGSLVLGGSVMIYGLLRTSEVAAGSLYGVLQQLNRFLSLSIILGVMYEVRKSGGRKSMNWPVAIACFLVFASGIIGFSKEGIFTPFVAWIFPAASGRYKMSVLQIMGLTLVFGFMVVYLVPYSQYGRTYKREGAPLSDTLDANAALLLHLNDVKRLYDAQSANDDAFGFTYYGTPQGFADRLHMLSPDDALINTTEEDGAYGLFPTLFYFENVIPHFLWPAKPILSFGNIYAHEVGIITSEEDTTTGVSFSPAGEIFHQARWLGVLVVLPILLTLLFTVSDSLGGDTRESPIALLLLVGFLHTAPEGGVGGIIGTIMGGTAILFVLAFITTRLMPLFSELVLGPVKKQFSRPKAAASIPARFIPPGRAARDAEQTSG